MRGITHLFFALALGPLMTVYFGHPFYLIVFVAIGSLIPDIDEPKSLVGRFTGILHLTMKHRGFFHSLIFGLLFGIMMYLFDKLTGIYYMVGLGSHLLLDCFTKGGVGLFYPLSFKIKGSFKTGGIFDWVILIVSVIVLLFVLLIF